MKSAVDKLKTQDKELFKKVNHQLIKTNGKGAAFAEALISGLLYSTRADPTGTENPEVVLLSRSLIEAVAAAKAKMTGKKESAGSVLKEAAVGGLPYAQEMMMEGIGDLSEEAGEVLDGTLDSGDVSTLYSLLKGAPPVEVQFRSRRVTFRELFLRLLVESESDR
jgi:hypothetical protein